MRKYTLFFLLALVGNTVFAQVAEVTVSGSARNRADKTPLAYANVVLKDVKDSVFVTGTVANADGRFTLANVRPGSYLLETSCIGFGNRQQTLYVGSLSAFLNLPPVELVADENLLEEVSITAMAGGIQRDKQVYSLAENISQSGGSVLQSMQNLPGITVQEGKVRLRGSDRVMVLLDGKQTALTGFGSQTGLDNIPASAIDRIEIINNPSARYDAGGTAGIINIVMKKSDRQGFNGKVGLTSGLGALWVRRENLPAIRPQYTATPKINPSLSLNYRKEKINFFVQADNLYTETLNKNEFVTRRYDDGNILRSQLKRNRNTNHLTSKAGFDWFADDQNTLTLSGMYGRETIIDRGDQPMFNADLSQRFRLWQFLEDEVLTTAMATAAFRHAFKEPGHRMDAGFSYTFDREDEKYFYDNHLPASTGTDDFALIADETVYDVNLDYVRPLRHGRMEAGLKFRDRNIPTNMVFHPGENSVLDAGADGWAVYSERIPAVYGNYVFETPKWEAELGLRVEYVRLKYDVTPDHNTYQSDGYHYTQPFPNFRLAYKPTATDRIALSYSRRVDRPGEGDIRIFPKYDDAEIIKVGNPALRPQFTNAIELGYKHDWQAGSFHAAVFHRFADGTITRISSTAPGSTLVYAIAQNAGKSRTTGIEAVWSQKVSSVYRFNLNGNVYRNQIDAFSVENRYPQPNVFSAPAQTAVSGDLKLNHTFAFGNGWNAQLSGVYLAPDIIPQGKTASRFSVDAGLKKSVQRGRGEVFLNVTDVFNTLVISREISGAGFRYDSKDYYETQVLRLGYSFRIGD